MRTTLNSEGAEPAPVLRSAVCGDLPGMLVLYRYLHPDDPVPDLAKARAAWEKLVDADGVTVFVADLVGTLVATCTLVVVPNLTHGTAPYGLIENVVTHADHRRQGHGHAVLDAALSAAWQAGCYKVMLMTGSRRESTLRFYEQAGFQRGSKTAFQIRRA